MKAHPRHSNSKQLRIPPTDDLAAWVRLRNDAERRSCARFWTVLLSGLAVAAQAVSIYCFYASLTRGGYAALGIFLAIPVGLVAMLVSWLAVALAVKFRCQIGFRWFLAGLIPVLTLPLFIILALYL